MSNVRLCWSEQKKLAAWHVSFGAGSVSCNDDMIKITAPDPYKPRIKQIVDTLKSLDSFEWTGDHFEITIKDGIYTVNISAQEGIK
jgi:hypothetical protein